MKVKRPLTLVAIAAICVVLLLFGRLYSHKEINIILITVDTLRFDHLGIYGYKKGHTPNIDKLAKNGMAFTQAITPFPRTTPALASLLTGLWPQHHGSREVIQPFDTGTTLAEVLQKKGYETIAISANLAATRKHNLGRGFKYFVDVLELPGEFAEHVTEKALDLTSRVPSAQPLLLWAHYMDPHYPYNPPVSFEDQPPATKCRELMKAVTKEQIPMEHVEENLNNIAENARPSCIELYDAEITYADREIGKLLDGLRSNRRLDNAIVIFTTDHGENFGEANLYYEHGPNVHDASVRIPLIVSGKHIKQGVDNNIIRLEDLMPTLLALTKTSDNLIPQTDGLNLSARFLKNSMQEDVIEPIAFIESGSALRPRYTKTLLSGTKNGYNCINSNRFSLCGYQNQKSFLYDTLLNPDMTIDVSNQHPEEKKKLLEASKVWLPEQARERAARTTRFKLVDHPLLEGGYKRALYDLQTDPAETHDVSESHPKVMNRLSKVLDRWISTFSKREGIKRDSKDLESLRTLGYIQ